MNTLGLPNVVYMADVYHLLDPVLPKQFRLEWFDLIQTNIKIMIFSKTKDQFNEHYDKAMNLLQNREKRQMKHKSSLRDFESLNDTYAT